MVLRRGVLYCTSGLQNILYNFEPSRTTPTYHQTQQFYAKEMYLSVDKDTIHMMQNTMPLPAITFHVYSPSLEGVNNHTSYKM